MKIISFSLWGNNPMYNNGAIANSKIAFKLLPDWICRFYVGSNTDQQTIHQLEKLSNVQVIDMKTEATMKSMVWRFLPCGEKDISVVLSRDADCRICPREVEAIDMWLNSNKDFHIVRDHPYHNAPILGGLWGARNQILKDIFELLENFEKSGAPDVKQYDQTFLRELVFNRIKDQSFINDEFFDKKNKLQTKRDTNGVFFLGEIFNADESFYSQEHRDLVIKFLKSWDQV